MDERAFLELALGLPAPERVVAPYTNRDTIDHRENLDPRIKEGIALTAHLVEEFPDRIRIVVDPGEEPVRMDEKVLGDNVPTRQDNLAEPLRYEVGRSIRVEGPIALNLASMLIVGSRAAILPNKGRSGFTGLTSGPMQGLPHQELVRDVANNYLIFGTDKSAKKRRMIVPEFDGIHETRHGLNLREKLLKEQEVAGLTKDLADESQRRVRMERLEEMLTIDGVQAIPPAKMLPGYTKAAQKIEVVIGDQTQTLEGFLDYDVKTRTLTLAQPVRIDPSTFGFDPHHLDVYSAADGNRVQWFDYASGAKAGLVSRMMAGMEREHHQQKLERLMSGTDRRAKLLTRPYAVPPDMKDLFAEAA